jgi:hypothetical protein
MSISLHEPAPTAHRFDDRSSEKLELSLVLESIAAKARNETHAAAVEPLYGLGAATHDRLSEIRITVPLRDAAQIIQILFGGVLAEIGVLDLALRKIWHHGFDRCGAAMNHAEAAAGIRGVTAALLLRRAFEQQHARALLARGKRGAQGSVAAADHDYIEHLVGHGHYRIPMYTTYQARIQIVKQCIRGTG